MAMSSRNEDAGSSTDECLIDNIDEYPLNIFDLDDSDIETCTSIYKNNIYRKTSSRRKFCIPLKGITIKEFVKTNDYLHPQTVIDKLIMKNKTAIAKSEEREKRQLEREKLLMKKKMSSKKVLSSKIIRKCRTHSDIKNTQNGKRVDSNKKKASQALSRTRSSTKPIKGKKNVNSESKLAKKNVRVTKSMETKKPAEHSKSADGKKLMEKVDDSLKKKPRELLRLKTQATYETKVCRSKKLRNGKTRADKSARDRVQKMNGEARKRSMKQVSKNEPAAKKRKQKDMTQKSIEKKETENKAAFFSLGNHSVNDGMISEPTEFNKLKTLKEKLEAVTNKVDVKMETDINIADVKQLSTYESDLKQIKTDVKQEVNVNKAELKQATSANKADLNTNKIDLKAMGSNKTDLKQPSSNKRDLKQANTNKVDLKQTSTNKTDVKQTAGINKSDLIQRSTNVVDTMKELITNKVDVKQEIIDKIQKEIAVPSQENSNAQTKRVSSKIDASEKELISEVLVLLKRSDELIGSVVETTVTSVNQEVDKNKSQCSVEDNVIQNNNEVNNIILSSLHDAEEVDISEVNQTVEQDGYDKTVSIIQTSSNEEVESVNMFIDNTVNETATDAEHCIQEAGSNLVLESHGQTMEIEDNSFDLTKLVDAEISQDKVDIIENMTQSNDTDDDSGVSDTYQRSIGSDTLDTIDVEQDGMELINTECEEQDTIEANSMSKVIKNKTRKNINDIPSTSTGLVSEEHVNVKESILEALGLKSLVKESVKDCQPTGTLNTEYTGTLKAVIKTDKGCRRMEMKPNNVEIKPIQDFQPNEHVLSFYSKTLKENYLSDSATDIFLKKSADITLGSSEGVSVPQVEINSGLKPVVQEENSAKSNEPLIVPEKSSSFSHHPNRCCFDVCKYCFGKFGSLDTPCHVGQLKNAERRRNILTCEPHLKLDTCLCDACFRFVDRKANRPPSKKKSRRNNTFNRTTCVVQACNQMARHTVKRKWLLRIGKKIAKLTLDDSKRGPRMIYGLCSQHYSFIDFYTLCGICRKRLNRNHMYNVGSELNDLNEILADDNIPTTLVDNMLLCKLCHYYASLRLKYGSPLQMSNSNQNYCEEFKKKILNCYNANISDTEEGSAAQVTELDAAVEPHITDDNDTTGSESSARLTGGQRKSSKKNHNVGLHDIASLLQPTLDTESDKGSTPTPTHIQVKFGNLNIGKLSNLNIGQQQETTREKQSPRGELPLIADFAFENCDTVRSWEKCVSTIQFDKGTKKLWQDLQKPYGNQSSFMRHLIMMEKYWRSGALVLTEQADPAAVKYVNSVKNRIRSLDGVSGECSSFQSASTSIPMSLPTPMPTPTTPSSSSSTSLVPMLTMLPTTTEHAVCERPKDCPVSATSLPTKKNVPSLAAARLPQMMKMTTVRTMRPVTPMVKRSRVRPLGPYLRPLATSGTLPVNNSVIVLDDDPPAPSTSAVVHPAMLAKLPASLSVTSFGAGAKAEPRVEETQSPFLASDKPSMSVFRETP